MMRAGRQLAPNAERYLKPRDEMAALFGDLPQAVAHTRELADRLQYTMADLGYRFPDYPVPPGETQISFLRQIVEIGARERYRPYGDRARAQIARELDLIEKLDPKTVHSALIFNPFLNALDMLAALLGEFGISPPPQASRKELLDRLNQFLLAQLVLGPGVERDDGDQPEHHHQRPDEHLAEAGCPSLRRFDRQ